MNVDLADFTQLNMQFYSCQWIERALRFCIDELSACNIAAPAGGYVSLCNYHGERISTEFIENARNVIRKLNNAGNESLCRGCTYLRKEEWNKKFDSYPVNLLTLGHFKQCTLKCNYCYLQLYDHATKMDVDYDVVSIVKAMIEDEILSPKANIIWGGGEPTLLKDFSELLEMLDNYGTKQIVYTNSTIFSGKLYDMLSKGSDIKVITSIDSGTPVLFQRMKGKDLFNTVVKNLSKYYSAGRNVFAKYILTKDNRSIDEFIAYANLLRQNNIFDTILDIDFNDRINVDIRALSKDIRDFRRILTANGVRSDEPGGGITCFTKEEQEEIMANAYPEKVNKDNISTIYLHIGNMKAGSSSIQKFLANNLEILRKNNIMAYGYDVPQAGYHLLSATRLSEDQVLALIRKNCVEEHFRTVIWSNEGLASWGTEQIENAFAALSHKNIKVKIVLFLRRQDMWIESVYKQTICYKDNLDEPIQSFQEWHKAEHVLNTLNYLDLIKRWENVFGKENIIIHPLEKEQMPEGLIHVFCRISNIASCFASNEMKDLHEYPAADFDHLEIAKILHSLPNLDAPLVRDFIHIFTSWSGNLENKPKYSYSTLSERQEILLQQSENNKIIAREYLFRLDGRLFYDEELREYPEYADYPGIPPAKIAQAMGYFYFRQENEISSLKHELKNMQRKLKFFDQYILLSHKTACPAHNTAPNQNIDPDLYNQVGDMLLEIGDLDGALMAKQKMIEVNPHVPWYHCALGAVYLARNEFDLALESVRTAISMNPNNIDFYRTLERIFATKGDTHGVSETQKIILNLTGNN